MTDAVRTEVTTVERLLAAITDPSVGSGDLIDEIAGSEAALADAVALVGRLAALPGEHVRGLEARLDAILDAVALVVAERGLPPSE